MSSGELLPGIADQFRMAFERNCITLVIAGYKKLIDTKTVDLSWEEEKITMKLASCMKQCTEERSLQISIVPEPRIYSDAFMASGDLPKEAPKIDLQLLTWSSKQELIYNIEAKNLAENDWTKPSGAKVRSSYLTARYIETGIGNFMNEHYANGCLAGYLLNGEAEKVIDKLNALLEKRKRTFENLSLTSAIEGYTFCYQSLHRRSTTGISFVLPHIILKFF